MTYSGKRVLVTGGLGFIGSNLSIRLAKSGASVTVLDNELADCGANAFNLQPVHSEVRVIRGDISDRRIVADLLNGQDYIFNLAGHLSHTDSMKDPLKDLHANTGAHIAFLEAVRERAPSARILYAGTRGQYGNPKKSPVDESASLEAMDVNGINKTAGEAYHLLYARQYGLHACSLRISNTYGPRHQMRHSRQGVLNWFVRRILDGEPIQIFGDGSQVRDAHYVDDVVDAMFVALASDRSKGEVYNLGGFPLSLKEIGELLIRIAGSGTIEFKPYPGDSKAVEVGSYVADIGKIKRDLGWAPRVTPEDGFRRTLEYYQEHRAQYW